jgi:hypothetical protein
MSLGEIGRDVLSVAVRAGAGRALSVALAASLGVVAAQAAPAATPSPAGMQRRVVRVVPQRRPYSPAYRSYRSGSMFTQRAAQQGYADGYARGRYDRSIGVRRPNPTGHGAYANALNGWVQSWGGSGTYRSHYRQSFVRGYWAGYSGRRR